MSIKLALAQGGHGSLLKLQAMDEEEVTIQAAAYTDSTLQIPANTVAIVATRTTTSIPGVSSYSIGISGNTSAWGSGISATSGGTNAQGVLSGGFGIFVGTSDIEVRITPNTTPSGSTGKVRLQVFYFEAVPPTG